MTTTRNLISTLLFSLSTLFSLVATAELATDADGAVADMQTRWAEANYQLADKAQKAAFEALLADVGSYTTSYADDAGVLIWSGIIKSTYAGVKGGLGALKFAKASKADLEKAMTIDPNALQGSAYTSLGTLYAKVPGWPIGFGDDEKAETLLKLALEINPKGIDPNYFYGEFLLDHKRRDEAKAYLNRAQQAAPRPGREVADGGRQKEIAALLEKLDDKK